jgi:hypothetical protein
MKKKVLLAGVVCAVIIAGCVGGGDTPSSTARKFYAAVGKNDIKTAVKISAPDTARFLEKFGDEAAKSIGARKEITNMTEKIEGDAAVVTVTFAGEAPANLHLTRINGKWKVDLNAKR